MKRFGIGVLAHFIAYLPAAIEMTAVYFVVDIAWGYILTWPVILVGAYVVHLYYYDPIRYELEKEFV